MTSERTVDVGYTLMCEQSGPRELVRDAEAAERAGFGLAVVSDHYFPWLDAQGHAPYAWSVLGAVSQVTETDVGAVVEAVRRFADAGFTVPQP